MDTYKAPWILFPPQESRREQSTSFCLFGKCPKLTRVKEVRCPFRNHCVLRSARLFMLSRAKLPYVLGLGIPVQQHEAGATTDCAMVLLGCSVDLPRPRSATNLPHALTMKRSNTTISMLQVFIYSVTNWNTPHILDMRGATSLIVQAETNFLTLDTSQGVQASHL